ncbi:protein Aster-B-like isoform X3 [Leptidea sinapis]|uniref:protein Aster-B-like isoform X3 n=1 Tax=Leptidea sinapis TaxID=189913 RepID=UPI0021C28515|nr:protein Aster-B-like isoform X3 [Leptidea sinapis]
MTSSELESRNTVLPMKSVENLVISSQDAIGQSISQALSFSGGVGGSNPIIQENSSRNISRSPSPSLRHIDIKQENVSETSENDSKNDITIQLPSIGGGDLALIVDPAGIPPAFRSDLNKQAVNPSSRSSDGSASRAKKKSWYNSLYPTYKTKCEDFKRLFKELPDDERLIVDYSCAIQRDILAHGRLYASQSYLCFYANIFGWETCLSIRWKDVTAITKEKTALVIPNAILVCTDTEKNFLTSFTGRDKAYLMLFRIWQNALMDQPLTTTEIWQWVHTCYGAELGFDSDEEGCPCDLPDEPQLPDTSEDAVDNSSMDLARELRDARESSPPLLNGSGLGTGAEDADMIPTDMSDTSESEPEKNHNGGEEICTSTHEGKILLREEFPFNIDQLFTMIFTNSKFNLELLAARKSSDYVQSPWEPQNGVKCRQVSYTLGLTSGPIGPKEVHVSETQVMNKCSKPGALYSIESTSENSGIPYADYFSVRAHYCLERVSDSMSRITFYGWVHYKKSMWPMVKTFLEKNAISGMEEFVALLTTQLRAQLRPTAPLARARRSRRRKHDVPSSPLCTVVSSTIPQAVPQPRVQNAAGRTPHLLLGILLLLLIINAMLYWKLYYSDTRPQIDLDILQSRLHSAHTEKTAEWSAELARHTRQQRHQLLAWREALERTVSHLLQTEKSLTKLLETIKPVLEKSEEETTHSEL